jgi:hypothetical protein
MTLLSQGEQGHATHPLRPIAITSHLALFLAQINAFLYGFYPGFFGYLMCMINPELMFIDLIDLVLHAHVRDFLMTRLHDG